MKKTDYLWLLGALVVGLLVRIPGISWGANFPEVWGFHHIDEYSHWVIAENLIDPRTPLRWSHPYPNGMAAHAAVPLTIYRALTGQLYTSAPDMTAIVVTGRVISVVYGVATILIIFLISRLLFRDQRPGLVAAWIMALGGLHVSQSHFFLADVPTLFWFLSGVYGLLLQFKKPEQNFAPYLMAAAFCFGVAFGLKMLFIGVPTLALIALWRPPRVLRAIYGGVFYLVGFGLVTLFSFGVFDIFNAISDSGFADPCDCSAWQSLGLYLIELPSLISFPILILAICGAGFLGYKFARSYPTERFWQIAITILLPLLFSTLITFTRSHFLRHLIPLIPWMALSAGWMLVRIGDGLKKRKLHPVLIYAPVFLYLLLFVFDGERFYINEPRNAAASWIYENIPSGATYSWGRHDNLPGYKYVEDPLNTQPAVLVVEMADANHILSGYGFKNSLPRDYRKIYDALSQENVDWTQALFAGTANYQAAARFREQYFMPEFVLVETLLGNRSRNYLSEIVVFRRDQP